jgi:hypothetical protein
VPALITVNPGEPVLRVAVFEESSMIQPLSGCPAFTPSTTTTPTPSPSSCTTKWIIALYSIRLDPQFRLLLEAASRPYAAAGRYAWHFARGKLRHKLRTDN